jgi:hypothetical protein
VPLNGFAHPKTFGSTILEALDHTSI